MTENSVAEFQANFQKVVAQIGPLFEKAKGPAAAYEALILRAARGEDIPEEQWLAVEGELADIRRKVGRLTDILNMQFQHMPAPLAAQAAAMAAEVRAQLAVLAPVAGNA